MSRAKLNLKFHNFISPRKAFTLAELLIAIAVFSIFFTILIDFFMGGLRQTDTASTQADNLRDTRLVLLNFEKDIREAIDILNFDDNDRYTNIHIKRYKTKDVKKEIEYVIYTLYKDKQDVGGLTMPFALCRNALNDEPQPTDVAIEPLIKGVMKSSGQVGIIKKAVEPTTNREIETEIAAYNMHYDPSYLNIPFLSYEDKQKERARSRYNGKFNGAPLGFTDKKKIVAIEITFITNDQHNIVNVYRSFIYNRKSFYDKLTDENF
ncbi:MAG TPA: type II secretion system protein [Candidatus Wallbacteria bacterium]|nr:type II secretion system protein [Candidatus Wallbacteria bacterium]